jgi:hypothetical protein
VPATSGWWPGGVTTGGGVRHRFTVEVPAGDEATFTPDAFEGQVGKTFYAEGPRGGDREAVIVGAQIIKNGASVILTLDIDGPVGDWDWP